MNTLGAKALAPLPRRLTLALFAAALGGLVLVDRRATLLGSLTTHPSLVDAAAAWDLTAGASLLCWWMLGRDFRWSAWSLVPLFFASLALAGVALPEGHRGGLRVAHLAAAPLELLALGFLVLKVRAGRRSFRSDPARDGPWDAQAAMQRASAEALGPGRLAEIIAYEMSVLYYALGARHHPAPADGLTYHRKTAYGAIVFAVLMATGVEVATVHFLASLWSHRLAWILTGLGVYGALWIYGDWRACRLRPVTARDGILRVRFGLRWRLDVPLRAVRAARLPTAQERADRRAVDLRLALPGTPWKVLELDRPVQAEGIYGLRRTVRTLGLGLDEPARLDAALAEANPEPESR
jgi:hypothetical protein